MSVSVGNHSLYRSNIQTAEFGLYQSYKHSASPRVYKSDINLVRGLYILLIDFKRNKKFGYKALSSLLLCKSAHAVRTTLNLDKKIFLHALKKPSLNKYLQIFTNH